MRHNMKRQTLRTALVAAFLSLAACQPASNNPGKSPDPVDTPQMKPSRVSAVRVATETISELSRIERAIRPFFGFVDGSPLTGIPELDAELKNPYADCQTAKRRTGSDWEVRWKCGLDSTESGKTEIEGVETTDFDRNTRVLTTAGRFEIRIFEDREPRAKAHTLQIRRTLSLTLAPRATRDNFSARVRLKSQVMKKNIRTGELGSNWSATSAGVLVGAAGKWALQPGFVTTFKGSLYGHGGERFTAWASGEYALKSDSEILLKGLVTGDCTKPLGTWTLTAKAAGENFETGLATTDAGLLESSGSQLLWPTLMCFQP